MAVVASPQTRAPDSGALCLAIVAHFYEKPTSPEHLQHLYAPDGAPMGVEQLLLAAKEIGLRAKRVERSFADLMRTPLPAIACGKDGAFFVIAKAAENDVLIHDIQARRPKKLTKDELDAVWNGSLILLTRRSLLPQSVRDFDIRWFIPEIVKHRRLLGEVMMASLFLQLFALISPLFFQVIVDKVLTHQSMSTLDVLVFGVVVMALFETALSVLRQYVLAHTTSRIDVTLGARLFRHMLDLPIAYFAARRVGETVARVRELETIRNFLTGSTLTSVLDLFFVFVFLGVMTCYSGLLTFIVLCTIPVYMVLASSVTPLLRRRIEEKFNRGSENQAFLVESINGIETIKAGAIEPQMRRRWEEQLAGYVSIGLKAANVANLGNNGAQLVSKLTSALTLWFGAHAVMAGDMTIGQLIAFNMLAGRVSGPILRLAQLWQDFQQVGISVRRLGDVLNAKPEPTTSASRAQLPAITGKVSFDHIKFRYTPDGPLVLDDVSLSAAPGEVIGIVGASGSGKSTLTKLLQRLYIPESGRVLVDGVDLAMADPVWLRRQIGVVLQENFLFNRTVRENIALTNPGMDMGLVVTAAKMAGAHDFILQLPQGYDTMLGERGGNLSGGQRQRIAIARALAANPRLLIFDEATSALDYESEEIIQRNMATICQGRTVFIIAHRLSTVYNASRIIVMDKGRIAEQGTHDSLVQQGGIYARLFRLQAGVRAGAAA